MTPAWYREAVAAHGQRVAAGTETKAGAARAIAALLAADPEFLAGIAGRDVNRWTRKHATRDLFESALFPALPAYLSVAVNAPPVRVADMTARDLEAAHRMIMTRTGNQMRGARRDRKAFLEFYNAVAPLVKTGRTVGEVMPLLEARQAAA